MADVQRLLRVPAFAAKNAQGRALPGGAARPTLTIVGEHLTFRPATADESDTLADLFLGVAEQESTRVAMRLYGFRSLEAARPFFRASWRVGENWRDSIVALSAGQIVGVLQTGESSVRLSLRLGLAVIARLGPIHALRLPRRLRVRSRVTPAYPGDAYVIREFHVTPACRGRGFGAEILAYAERDARNRGFDEMAVQVLTSNPAQRAYRRAGFEPVLTLTDPEFLRITGADGNVLLAKHLT